MHPRADPLVRRSHSSMLVTLPNRARRFLDWIDWTVPAVRVIQTAGSDRRCDFASMPDHSERPWFSMDSGPTGLPTAETGNADTAFSLVSTGPSEKKGLPGVHLQVSSEPNRVGTTPPL